MEIDLENLSDHDEPYPTEVNNGRSNGNAPGRLQYAEMVERAVTSEEVEDILTLFETLDRRSLAVALSSLCLIADKCVSEKQKHRVKGIARDVLYDEQSSRGDRKAAISALKALLDGTYWTHLLLLLETLDEPQFHIVRPVLPRFDNLLTFVAPEGSLTPEWVWLVFRRATLHSNGWIRLWGLQKAITLPVSMFLLESKPLTSLLLPLLNSVDMIWRLIEREDLNEFLEQLGSIVSGIFEDVKEENAYSQLIDLLECVEAMSCPFTYYFISIILLRIAPKPILRPGDFMLCRRIISRINHVPYLVLRNEALASFVRIFAKLTDWTDQDAFYSFSSFVRTISDTSDGHSAERLDSLFDTLSSVWNGVDAFFEPKMVIDTVFLYRTTNYEDEDVDWLLWAKARHLRISDQLETELERNIVESLCDGSEHTVVDRLIGLWVARTDGNSADISESFSSILTEYMTMRVFTMEGTMFDRSLCANVFVPLMGKCPTLAVVLSSCILEFLKQNVSTERQAVLLSILEACISGGNSSLAGIEDYLGTTPFEAKLPKKSVSAVSSREFQRIAEGVHAARTRLFTRFLLDATKDWARLADEIVQILDCASLYERKEELLRILRKCLDKIPSSETELLLRIVNASNSLVAEERKSLNSLPALKMVMSIALHETVLKNEKAAERSRKLFDDHFSHSSLSLSVALVLAQSISAAEKYLDEDWAKQIMNLAIFGPVPKKDGKVLTSAYEMIYSAENGKIETSGSNELARLHETVQRDRMMATNVAVILSETSQRFAARIAKEILDECAVQDQSSSKSFGLSYAHRAKSRAVSVLLLIVDNVTDKAVLEQLYTRSVSFVADPCQQFSIKLIVEWILVKLVVKHPEYFDRLIAEEKQLAAKRIGSVSSWLNILVHYARAKNYESTCIRRVLELLVPWTTAQNFAVRCTAIAGCRILYQQMFSKEEKAEFSLVRGIIEFDSEPAGNSRRIVDNLCADFYFAHLHAIKHFDLQTALCTVAERTGLPADERIPLRLIVELNRSRVRSLNEDPEFLNAESLVYNSLSKCGTCAPEMILPIDASSNEVDESDNSPHGDASPEEGSLQKKIITSHKQKPEDCSMIVVASLIDKPANLGGLCRTCEIFGVDSLVVADLQLTKDVSFVALSLSSENWQKIEAVRPDSLTEYLTDLRSKGYTVIAAEQTTDSRKMHEFQFPKKCVLVMGDEKEGVPTRLLRCVDQTVEITQLGQTRSLNVHVTAAIFISKYAEQRLIPNL